MRRSGAPLELRGGGKARAPCCNSLRRGSGAASGEFAKLHDCGREGERGNRMPRAGEVRGRTSQTALLEARYSSQPRSAPLAPAPLGPAAAPETRSAACRRPFFRVWTSPAATGEPNHDEGRGDPRSSSECGPQRTAGVEGKLNGGAGAVPQWRESGARARAPARPATEVT